MEVFESLGRAYARFERKIEGGIEIGSRYDVVERGERDVNLCWSIHVV